MKKLVKIITVETVILWLESALTLDSDSWIPFWVLIATTLYLSLVTYANLDWKGEKMVVKSREIGENPTTVIVNSVDADNWVKKVATLLSKEKHNGNLSDGYIVIGHTYQPSTSSTGTAETSS